MSLHEPDFSSDPQSLTVDSIQWECHRFTDLAVLCFIVVNGRILLINKKRGLGAGKVNGPGGRLERGETPEQAAVRETQEEVGLTPTGLEKRAELSFVFTDGYSLFVSAFFANGFTGTPIERDDLGRSSGLGDDRAEERRHADSRRLSLLPRDIDGLGALEGLGRPGRHDGSTWRGGLDRLGAEAARGE